MKNKINNKHLVIFSKAPKIIAHPTEVIGDPLEYEKREEQGDFTDENKLQTLNSIDLTVPIKKVELQPMESFNECNSNS